MNKFVTAIAGSAEGIKLQRAKNTATAAKLAQEALINDKRKVVQGLEAQLNQQLDIGPDDSTSLRPVSADFNAEEWVASVHTLKRSLVRANEDLETAEATYNEWFADVEV